VYFVPLQGFDDAVKVGKVIEDYKCDDLAIATLAAISSELHQEDYYVLPTAMRRAARLGNPFG
jgi:hypothetical protein